LGRRHRGGEHLRGDTDNDWFDFLASLSGIDEVNFWKPSAGNFKAIGEGERFAFRLKSPRNKIGGFGTFVKSSSLPIQMAWEAFGSKNVFQVCPLWLRQSLVIEPARS